MIKKEFFYLPFDKQSFCITEGWRYSEQEREVHGMTGHGGIDFALPRGTPVLASADGLAISSYFCRTLIRDGKPLGEKSDILWVLDSGLPKFSDVPKV